MVGGGACVVVVLLVVVGDGSRTAREINGAAGSAREVDGDPDSVLVFAQANTPRATAARSQPSLAGGKQVTTKS